MILSGYVPRQYLNRMRERLNHTHSRALEWSGYGVDSGFFSCLSTNTLGKSDKEEAEELSGQDRWMILLLMKEISSE